MTIAEAKRKPLEVPQEFAEAYEAYSQLDAVRDELISDKTRYLRFVLSAGGKLRFFDTFREAVESAKERGMFGRCHIDIVSPWHEGRGQPADPEYRTGADIGCHLRLRIGHAVGLAPPGGASEEVDCVIDSGADVTVIPRDAAERIGLPRVGVYKGAGLDGRPALYWRYLASLSLGTAGFDIGRWTVGACAKAPALIGRDILWRCRLSYPVDGRLSLTWRGGAP